MLTRRELLRGAGAGLALGAAGVRGGPALAGRRALGPRRRLLMVLAYGGWDTSYALDPKEPDSVAVPAGHARSFGGLDVFVDDSRPNVTAFFERHGARSAIVRGLSTDAINHSECMIRMATGTRQSTSPDLAAIVAQESGLDKPVPYLVLGEIAYAGPYAASAARVGATNQLAGLLTPDAASGDGAGPLVPTAHERALLARYTEASAARARAGRGAHGANRRRIEDFEQSLRRADRLRALGGFGRRGETQSLQAQVDVAVAALEQGVSQAVTLSTRQPWDTHTQNELQGEFHEVTFGALSKLLDELERRPGLTAGSTMLDDTVVLCLSDMSRTPKQNGFGGKEHWPVIAALVMGAGVRGGHVVGATSPDAQALAIDLTTGSPQVDGVKPLYSHFAAGVLALCGIDPATHFETPPLEAIRAASAG